MNYGSRSWTFLRTGQVNHASSILNLAANSNSVLPTRNNDEAPKQILQDPRAKISHNAFEIILQELPNQSVHAQDQPDPDSVNSHVQNSKTANAICYLCKQQHQLSQGNREYSQASSIFGANDNKCF